MKLKFGLTVLALCFSTFALSSFTRADEVKDEAKVDTAPIKIIVEKWLGLVDSGAYDQSWKKSSEIFRARVKQDEWKDQIDKVRAPLGKVVKRELRLRQTESSMPGVPDGHYVIFQYVTTFENKKDATETVTPHLDKDNHWRVSGYVIH